MSTLADGVKQSYNIVDSTIKVEYMVACEAVKEEMWLKKFIIDVEDLEIIQW